MVGVIINTKVVKYRDAIIFTSYIDPIPGTNTRGS